MTTLEARWLLISVVDNQVYAKTKELENKLFKQKCASTESPWFVVGLNHLQFNCSIPFWDKTKSGEERNAEVIRFSTTCRSEILRKLYQISSGTHEEKLTAAMMKFENWKDDVELTHRIDDIVRSLGIAPNRGISTGSRFSKMFEKNN